MKIPKKILDSFNSGKQSTGNENYNKAHNLPSWEQAAFLRIVARSIYGICGRKRKITQKDLNNYIPYSQSEIAFVNRLNNGA